MSEHYTKLTLAFLSRVETTVNPIKRVDISSLTPETFVEQYQKTGSPNFSSGRVLRQNLCSIASALNKRAFIYIHHAFVFMLEDMTVIDKSPSDTHIILADEIHFQEYIGIVGISSTQKIIIWGLGE